MGNAEPSAPRPASPSLCTLGNGTGLVFTFQHLTLPAIALALSSLAIVARVTRAAVREEAGREEAMVEGEGSRGPGQHQQRKP